MWFCQVFGSSFIGNQVQVLCQAVSTSTTVKVKCKYFDKLLVYVLFSDYDPPKYDYWIIKTSYFKVNYLLRHKIYTNIQWTLMNSKASLFFITINICFFKINTNSHENLVLQYQIVWLRKIVFDFNILIKIMHRICSWDHIQGRWPA